MRILLVHLHQIIPGLLLLILTPPIHTSLSPVTADSAARDNGILEEAPSETSERPALSHSPDPTSDIPWSAGTTGVADIQAAFNNARAAENRQLGTSILMLTLPSQTTWNAMTDSDKALWLINRERMDRGVTPLHGLETNVGGAAQYYADYLLDNNAWGHTADGRDPWMRLSDNTTIGACQDFLSVAENLAVFVTSGSSIPLPIERSIYMWMYDDGDCCNWGHRHAILWYPYNDNSGPSGREGFLGIGRANGGPYQGSFSQSWPFAEIIVMNVFDPCASWTYADLPGPATLNTPSGSITDTTPPYSWSISPDTAATDPATWYHLWVNGPSGKVFSQWYEASAVCGASACSVTPAHELRRGNHTWWVQTWNKAGHGPWSAAKTFSLPSPSAPGKALLTSPSGSITETTPDYTWNRVDGATWYHLWVNGPSGNVIQQWYDALAVCSVTTCSVTPTQVLGGSSHTWWVRTWNTGGHGPWSDAMHFSLPVPPGMAILVSPTGNMAGPRPTYKWNKVGTSTWYQLWISRVNSDGSVSAVHSQWYESEAVCGASTCSSTPAVDLANGTYRWWVRTWNSAGHGPWSAAGNFSIGP